MKKDRPLRRSPDMVTRKINNEQILLPVYRESDEINCIYALNKSAAAVWGLINGKRTPLEIKEKLSDNFNFTARQADARFKVLIRELRHIKAVL